LQTIGHLFNEELIVCQSVLRTGRCFYDFESAGQPWRKKSGRAIIWRNNTDLANETGPVLRKRSCLPKTRRNEPMFVLRQWPCSACNCRF